MQASVSRFNENGFTWIELMIAVALMLVLSLAMVQSLSLLKARSASQPVQARAMAFGEYIEAAIPRGAPRLQGGDAAFNKLIDRLDSLAGRLFPAGRVVVGVECGDGPCVMFTWGNRQCAAGSAAWSDFRERQCVRIDL